MTFSLLLQRPRAELLIGASQHAELNAAAPERIRVALHRCAWTCNVCGVRLPGLMEIDHFHEHGPGPGGGIATICQFCHDLKHPLWAAFSHRLIPVALPEMDQAALTRLCWIMLSICLRDALGAQRLRPVTHALVLRRIQAGRMLGTLNMTEAFEALLGAADVEDAARANAIAARLDARVRLMPAAILDLSRLCAWTGAGFVPVSRRALREATRQPLPPGDADAILAEAHSLAQRGRGDAQARDGAGDIAGCGADPDPQPEIHPQPAAGHAAFVKGAAAAPEALCAAPSGRPAQAGPPPAPEPACAPEEEGMEP